MFRLNLHGISKTREVKMTEQELQKHQKWLRQKYGNDGDDVFHQAWIYAQRYGGIEKVNQNLFGLLCRWAARELKKHEMHEIPFSCLVQENADQTDEVEFDPEDPAWEKDFVAIEEREEIEKLQGQWFLNALLKAAEPKPSKVTTDADIHREQMKLFV